MNFDIPFVMINYHNTTDDYHNATREACYNCDNKFTMSTLRMHNEDNSRENVKKRNRKKMENFTRNGK